MHELARRAAEITGTTQTSAIEEALLLLLRKHGVDPAEAAHAQRLELVRRRLAQIDVEVERTLPGPVTSADHLYDSTGLPR